MRLAGCDLRCRWCDTPYAMEALQGQDITIEQIMSQVSAYECANVVVTGGEPLIAEELPELLKALTENGEHITVETSATHFREITCNLISISPKLSNSLPARTDNLRYKEQDRLNISAIRNYIDRHDYQLKFVVENETDLPEIEQVLKQLQDSEKNREIDRNKVFLMPQAQTRKQHNQLGPRIVQMCLKKGFRYCPRLQIELWDNQRKR
ncbi:MAG: 7-carboxy-7-deazaguanine synthase QueE [Sedimentisphaerales bacterium]|nr:7-carboxy-7-deazaguanine synthase QueE [Sedimentisphaerales bacterium]